MPLYAKSVLTKLFSQYSIAQYSTKDLHCRLKNLLKSNINLQFTRTHRDNYTSNIEKSQKTVVI